MPKRSDLSPPKAPALFAVLHKKAVTAWVIDLPDAGVIAIFSDGDGIHTTDSTERALNFVNRAEGTKGKLRSLNVGWSQRHR